MRLPTLLAAASVATSLVSGEDTRVQRGLRSEGDHAAKRSENDEYWAAYLQSVDSFPNPAPTPPPTSTCQLDVSLNCTYVSPSTGEVMPCDELPPIDTLSCSCSSCPREMLFTYTGNDCAGLEGCTDSGVAPGGPAIIKFFPCDETVAAVTQTVQVNDTITVSLGGACLPTCMDVTITDAVSGVVEQSFNIDTTCSATTGGLVLKDSYGAIDFIGYTCEEGDVNNCIQEVVYGVTACNQGVDSITFYDLIFSFDGDVQDLLNGLTPVIPPGECAEELLNAFIDRCTEHEYIANVTCNGTNPVTGLPKPCDDTAEVIITIPAPPTLPPTTPVAPPVTPPVVPPTAPVAPPTTPTTPTTPTAPVAPPTTPTAPVAPPTTPTAPVVPPTTPTAPVVPPTAPVAPPTTPTAPVVPPTAPVAPPTTPTAPVMPPSMPTAPVAPPSTPGEPGTPAPSSNAMTPPPALPPVVPPTGPPPTTPSVPPPTTPSVPPPTTPSVPPPTTPSVPPPTTPSVPTPSVPPPTLLPPGPSTPAPTTPAMTLPPGVGPTPPPAVLPPTVPPPTVNPDCNLDVSLNCTYTSPETGEIMPCEEIPAVDDLSCSCTDCVREMRFTYTGNSCAGLEGCTDSGMIPAGPAVVSFFPCDETVPAFTQNVAVGDALIVSLDGACLPTCMDVTVTDAVQNVVVQSFTIDTTCDGSGGLLLKDSYGAIDFIGFTCDETDVNNCLQEIVLGITACNAGTNDLTFYGLLFYFDGDILDILNGNTPLIPPGVCLEQLITQYVDRCTEGQYVANVTCNATNPITGLPAPCDDSDEVIITITVPNATMPPVPPPGFTPAPTTPAMTMPPVSTPPPGLPTTPPPGIPPTNPPGLPTTPPPGIPPTTPPGAGTPAPTTPAMTMPPFSTPPPGPPSTPPPGPPSTPPPGVAPTLPPVVPPTLPPSTPTTPSVPTTPSPTANAAPVPTISPAPTGECNIDISVLPECPAIPCNFDRCLERPFRMEFRVDTRTCDQSYLRRCPGIDPDTCSCIRDTVIGSDVWASQKFFCTDFDAGPPAAGTNGTFYIRAYPEKDTTVTYFAGPVTTPGGLFNATAPSGEEEVEANMYLELYTCADSSCSGPGTMLQQVLFHSSCSQQLYLFDIFGSFQLVEFESTNLGLVSSFAAPATSFTIALDASATGSTLVLDFMSIVVLPEDSEFLEPQVLTFDVAGTTIPPSFTVDANVNLLIGQSFQVVTTIGGQLDGLGCFDVSNSTLQCNATVTPTVEGEKKGNLYINDTATGGGGPGGPGGNNTATSKKNKAARRERRWLL